MENSEWMRAVEARHSVRSYLEQAIEPATAEALEADLCELNRQSGLNMQLFLNEPKVFGGMMAHFGSFSGVNNYIALVGAKAEDLEERCGYFGELAVLKAQALGLNSCWVAVTYNKAKCRAKIASGEKLCCVIALGYGKTMGTPHRSKEISEVSEGPSPLPEWFIRGVECALKAPTGMNQQNFRFKLTPDGVQAEAGRGSYSRIDLGIAKCHFEIGAGKENFKWNEAK